MIYIIGAGGAGSWLANCLVRLLKGGGDVTLIDGDTLEQKNLDRQLFDPSEIGQNKAEALAKRLKCHSVAGWFTADMQEYAPGDLFFSCVDNHPGRSDILKTCDDNECCCIIGGNETLSSEAYYYKPEWKGTNLDPRKFYPEIETNKDDDPRKVSIGCTGEAQIKNPQLATSNLMSVALALHLYVVWRMEAPKLAEATLPHLPHRLSCTLSRLESFKAQIEEGKSNG